MEFSAQQIQDFLVREFGLFLWLEEALVEDEELQEIITSGRPKIESELKDGVRLCKLVRLIDPDYAPAVKEGEAHVAYKCRQKIKLFLEGCADLGVPSHNLFLVTELYDERNIMRVLECLEKLAEVADARWFFPFKIKGKKKIILEMGKFFTKEEQERAITILRKSQPTSRASMTLGSIVHRDDGDARNRPVSLASWTQQRPAAHTLNGPPMPSFSRSASDDSPRNRPPPPSRLVRNAVGDELSRAGSSLSRVEHKNSEQATATTAAAAKEAEAAREKERREREESELQEQRQAEERLERAIVRFQSFFRGHQARKLFRAHMRQALRRENVAREIYRTEHAYIYNLRLLVHVFLSTLDARPNWHVRGGQAIELDKMKILSRQIAPILGFNKKLITEYLEPRMQNWSFHSKLGDIFVQISAYLKLYCDYVNNYGLALQELLEAKKKSSTLADFLKAQQEIPREFAIPSVEGNVNSAYTKTQDFRRAVQGRVGDIADYLIQPIQRIPRYLLLLKELLRFTDPTHPDYEELQRALEGIREVTEFIENQTNKAQNLSKLASIQSRLVPANQLKLVQPHRKFVKEGRVLVRKSKKKDKQERVLFLFTDLLLETKPKHSKTKSWEDCPLKIKQTLDLTVVCAMTRVSVGDSDHGFLIVKEDRRLKEVLLDVQCTTKIERYDWATAIHAAKRSVTTQLQERAELLNKAGAFDRVAGVKTFSEGHGQGKLPLPKQWDAGGTARQWAVVNYATVGRSHSGKLLSQDEKRASKEQKKREKEERKNAKRPDKVRSDVGATSNSDADSPRQSPGLGTQVQGADQPRKGHTRNKSWTLSIKDASKRNKLDRGSDKDHTFDGIPPTSPRSPSSEASTPPPLSPLPPQLSMSMPSLPSPCDDLSTIRQGTHANGNRPPIPFMTPRQPAPMFAHVALMTPGSLGSSSSGGTSSGVRSPPSFGSLSSNSSASSSPASSPRGHPPLSPSSSGTSAGNNSSSNSGAGTTTATKVPSPRSRGFTYMQSLDQQMSPLAINARAAPYCPPSPGSGSGKSASTIVPSTSSEQHPVIMRAVSVTSLTSMATSSVPSPSSGSMSAPHSTVESGGGASLLSPGRRPPPVPPKSAKPSVLMSQDSLPAVRAKPS